MGDAIGQLPIALATIALEAGDKIERVPTSIRPDRIARRVPNAFRLTRQSRRFGRRTSRSPLTDNDFV